MLVTTRQTFRNAFGTTVPVLAPLYGADFEPWQVASEGEFQCGNSDRCELLLGMDGIEAQHCSLLYRSGALRIRRDNGRVWVNDLPVSRETDLSPGDILTIGPVSFEVGQIDRQDERRPAQPETEKSPPSIRNEFSESRQPFGAMPQSTEAIETASVLVRESVGAAETLLKQIEGRMHALELREQECQDRAQATEAREAGIRDYERRIEARDNELARLQHDVEMQHAAMSRQCEALQALQEDIDSRHAELAQQTAALQTREEELNSRATEVHRRICQFKADVRECEARQQEAVAEESQRAAQSLKATAADLVEQQQLSEALQMSEQRCRDLFEERETLLTAVCELKSALENARSDIQQASRIRAETATHEQTLSLLFQRIEECSVQLTLTDSLLVQTNEKLETAQALAAQLTEERDELSRRIETTSSAAESESADDTEMQLLSEIESLRSELHQRSAGDHAHQSESEFRDMLAKRDDRIRDLQAEIDSLREQVETLAMRSDEGADPAEIDQLRVRVADADELLRDRDDVIQELRARLLQQPKQTPANPDSQERLQNESRELDRRAALLDQRDEELRERSRRIDQSEEEIDLQYRQLLESRQQLEQARAEIQAAIRQHAELTSDPDPAKPAWKSTASGDDGLSAGARDRFEASPMSADSAAEGTLTADNLQSENDLRFELAGLFGLHKTPELSPAATRSQAEDFVDLCEPAGESRAIAFRFDADTPGFIQGNSADPPLAAAANTPREENSDDFVREYMEQLLSRSRQSAGNALPEELKPAEAAEKSSGSSPGTRQTRSSTEDSSPKASPRVRSFIDQYMAGDFGDLTGDGSITGSPAPVSESPPATEPVESTEPALPRAKIDLRKMRENMDSFRTLSNQSVEHALGCHALRRERHNLNGRIMLVLALLGMSLFLAIANTMGIIDYPLLTWVTLVAAMGAATELGQKLYGRIARRKGVLATSDAAAHPGQDPVLERNVSVSHHAFTTAIESGETCGLSEDPRGSQPHPDLPDPPHTRISDNAERSSRYFEL